ncbi:uncharacterized, partial [Tachysurus ichikawai]
MVWAPRQRGTAYLCLSAESRHKLQADRSRDTSQGQWAVPPSLFQPIIASAPR